MRGFRVLSSGGKGSQFTGSSSRVQKTHFSAAWGLCHTVLVAFSRGRERDYMAAKKAKRSGARGRSAPFRRVLRFPQVRGKTVERVELSLTDEEYSIEIRFDDKTALNVDMEPEPGIKVTPDYADWKTGNWKTIKRWQPIHYKSNRI